jgi:hypothetical protein
LGALFVVRCSFFGFERTAKSEERTALYQVNEDAIIQELGEKWLPHQSAAT